MTKTEGASLDRLRLLAEDEEDLCVIAAALQDAVTRIGDIRWEREGRRLTLEVNRLRREADGDGRERVRSGVQLGSVTAVKARNLVQGAPEATVELLAVGFEPAEPPGGVVIFAFDNGGDLAVEVECVDAALADISEPWPADRAPPHDG